MSVDVVKDSVSLFDQVKPEMFDNTNWKVLPVSTSALEISSRELLPGKQFVRISTVADFPIDLLAQLARPEVFFHPRRVDFDERIEECGVVEVLGPGDAIAFINLRMHPTAHSILALAGSASALQQALLSGKVTKAVFGKMDVVRQRVRMRLRQDVPHDGAFAVEVSSVDGLALAAEAVHIFDVCRDDPSKTVVTQVRPMPRAPTWALRLALPRIAARRMQMFHRYAHALVTDRSTLANESILVSASYVVLSLRKCQKGPPLLPSPGIDLFAACSKTNLFGTKDCAPACCWDGDVLVFSKYVRRLLVHIGYRNARVFDSLDGRTLVPYQACMDRGTWNRVSEKLMAAMCRMRAVYRQIHNSSAGPSLSTGYGPRFCKFEDKFQPSASNTASPISQEVKKTFLHFSDGVSPLVSAGRSRSNSQPR